MSLRARLLWVLVFTGCCVPCLGAQAYFPVGSFGSVTQEEKFVAEWYSRQLKALHEKPLYPAAATGEVYRFLWLRTFDHPISVRLEVREDGTGTVITRRANGAGGYAPGKLVEDRTNFSTRDQVAEFLGKVTKFRFWDQPSYDSKNSGCDGSEWVVEAVKSGKYHIVGRWSPSNGPVFELGSDLAFRLAKLNIPKGKLY